MGVKVNLLALIINTYMYNLTYYHNSTIRGFVWVATVLVFALIIVVGSIPSSAKAYTLLGSQMSIGARSNNVTSLQTFLASNNLLYPEAMVTGYFGPLTQRAVTQFQLAYNLPPVGAVGPLTLAKMNAMIAGGEELDVSSPEITDRDVKIDGDDVTLTWKTNESARAKLFYSTAPLSQFETSASQTEPIISGAVWTSNDFSRSKEASLKDLEDNTTYYYVIEAIDASGNVRVTTQGVFQTT